MSKDTSAPSILRIAAKCSDTCCTQLLDGEGRIIREKNGYVPYIQGLGGGDYVELRIDIQTGQLVGWSCEDPAGMFNPDPQH